MLEKLRCWQKQKGNEDFRHVKTNCGRIVEYPKKKQEHEIGLSLA